MRYKIESMLILLLCMNLHAAKLSSDHKISATGSAKPPKPAAHHTCSSCQSDQEDKQVQEMAINTLASMAKNLVQIGTDPHNAAVVGAQVIQMLSSFVNFVSFAMKNPRLAELLQDEEFRETLRSSIMLSIEEHEPEPIDEDSIIL